MGEEYNVKGSKLYITSTESLNSDNIKDFEALEWTEIKCAGPLELPFEDDGRDPIYCECCGSMIGYTDGDE